MGKMVKTSLVVGGVEYLKMYRDPESVTEKDLKFAEDLFVFETGYRLKDFSIVLEEI